MDYGFIYETTNIITGKKYIGKCATTVNNRDEYLGSGVDLKKDIKALGRENFTRKILQYAKSEDELQELEIHYLLKAGVPNEHYYNKKVTHGGGERYSRMSEETLKRKKESLKAHATGTHNNMYNKPKTNTQIDSISKANSKEVSIDGTTYKSMTEASKALGIGVTTLSFRLDSPNFDKYIRLVPKTSKKKGVARTNKKRQVSIEGNVYDSIVVASRALECSTTKVTKRCNAEWCEDWFFL